MISGEILMICAEAKKSRKISDRELQKYKSEVGNLEPKFGAKRRALIEALLNRRIIEMDGASRKADELRKGKRKIPEHLSKQALFSMIEHLETLAVIVAIGAYQTAELNLTLGDEWAKYEQYDRYGRIQGIIPHRGQFLDLNAGAGQSGGLSSLTSDG